MVFVNVANVRQGVTLGMAIAMWTKFVTANKICQCSVLFCSVLNIIRKIGPSDEYFC